MFIFLTKKVCIKTLYAKFQKMAERFPDLILDTPAEESHKIKRLCILQLAMLSAVLLNEGKNVEPEFYFNPKFSASSSESSMFILSNAVEKVLPCASVIKLKVPPPPKDS